MKDLVIRTGTFTSGGKTKGRYTKLGVLMENDNGFFLLLDPSVSLAGAYALQRIDNPQKTGDRVMVSVFDRDDKPRAVTPITPVQEPDGKPDEFDDDIPF